MAGPPQALALSSLSWSRMNARRHVEQFGSLLHPALAVRAAGGVGNARGIPCAVVTGTGVRMPGPDFGVDIYAVRSAGPVALDITSTDPASSYGKTSRLCAHCRWICPVPATHSA